MGRDRGSKGSRAGRGSVVRLRPLWISGRPDGHGNKTRVVVRTYSEKKLGTGVRFAKSSCYSFPRDEQAAPAGSGLQPAGLGLGARGPYPVRAAANECQLVRTSAAKRVQLLPLCSAGGGSLLWSS
jgi:hypothetical protein